MVDESRKKELEALLRVFAEKQAARIPSANQSQTSRQANKENKRKGLEALFTAYALEQANRESKEKRQKYFYPPTTPEDIAAVVNYGVVKGILDPTQDRVALDLMNPAEIRRTIQAGYLDPADLPLLKYRLERLLGLTTSKKPPSGQEMLSSLAYYYRGNVARLNAIRKEALEGMEEDFRYGDMTAEELAKFRSEANRIIDQYMSLK